MTKQASTLHRIIIVGGGAGGLELATRLGDTLGKRKQAKIILVDKDRSHIWKPKLHEIAAGSMDYTLHEVDYLAHAHWHHFSYCIGTMTHVDRDTKQVYLAENLDTEGRQITPARHLTYDTLVMAIGSRTNDFGIQGVEKYAIQLDTTEQAKRFHQRLVNTCIRSHEKTDEEGSREVSIAIVGAGATGVELAAELHNTLRELIQYGLDNIKPNTDIHIHLIEAAPRILPALPDPIANSANAILNKLQVKVHTSSQVKEVTQEGVKLASGEFINAELVVWAAGVRAQLCLTRMGDLETNRINQLVVTPQLQTTLDPNIFAMGDCAACHWQGKEQNINIPPRAQAAHQQAKYLYKMIPKHIKGEPLTPYQYQDYGSLIALGNNRATGGLMGNISRGTFFIEGHLARFMYNVLYKSHQINTKGIWKTGLEWLAGKIRHSTGPKVKLH